MLGYFNINFTIYRQILKVQLLWKSGNKTATSRVLTGQITPWISGWDNLYNMFLLKKKKIAKIKIKKYFFNL